MAIILSAFFYSIENSYGIPYGIKTLRVAHFVMAILKYNPADA